VALTNEDIEEIINKKLNSYLSSNKVDDGKVDKDNVDFLLSNKVDSRNVVDYTFVGTSEEAFEHNLGRIPTGRIILNQTQDARIYGDQTSWTTKRVTLRSTVANNKVRFLFL